MDARLQELLNKFAATGDPDVAVAVAHAMVRSRAGISNGAAMLIPTLGSRITLTEDWTFTLHGERRNTKFWIKMLGLPTEFTSEVEFDNSIWRQPPRQVEMTLPAGTVLRVDRIFIRQGMDDFDSVTFVAEKIPKSNAEPERRHFAKKGTPKVIGRFWAPLNEVNRIVGTWDESTLPKPRGEQNAEAGTAR